MPTLDGSGRRGWVSDTSIRTTAVSCSYSRRKFEVPPRYASVACGVCRELGDDQSDRVVERRAGRNAPVVKLPQGELTREAGIEPSRGIRVGKHTYGY